MRTLRFARLLLAAAADCNASTVGTTSEGLYTADYVFWKARASRGR